MRRISRILFTGVVLGAVLLAAGLLFRTYYFHRFDDLIIKAAKEHRLDPELIRALVHEESFFNPRAVGDAGEKGLMQVSPIVVREWAAARGYAGEQEALAKYFGGKEEDARGAAALFVPEANLEVGGWYLHSLLTKYQSESEPLVFALAAYNAGPTNADRWLKPVSGADRHDRERLIERIEFPKTRDYVRNIISRYESEKR